MTEIAAQNWPAYTVIIIVNGEQEKYLNRVCRIFHQKYVNKIKGKADGAVAEEEIQKNIQALESFQKVSVGRELRMIKLKEESNKLYREKGEPEKYAIVNNVNAGLSES